MQDEVIISYRGGELCARLACEIDHHTARRLRERIDSALFSEKPECFVMDFSEVRFMDSSGIGLILGRRETCMALGAGIRLVGLSPTLLKLLRLSGIDKLDNLSIMK